MSDTSNLVNLSKYRVEYTRPKDPKGSLVLRDTRDNSNGVFGVKGIDQITELYYAMLSMMKANEKEIEAKSKYGQEKKLLALLEKAALEKMSEIGISANKDEIKIGRLCLRFHLDEHAQISLFLYDSTEITPLTGIYLFTSEIAKLVKYMNTQFGVGETSLPFINVKNDDFLDL